MKTIYNVYVPIESQEQANRMKQISIDYGLPYWSDEIAFEITCLQNENSFFHCYTIDDEFFIVDLNKDEIPCGTQVTESEFLELVKINFANSK